MFFQRVVNISVMHVFPLFISAELLELHSAADRGCRRVMRTYRAVPDIIYSAEFLPQLNYILLSNGVRTYDSCYREFIVR